MGRPGCEAMIKLTQLNGRPIVINVDLIEYVESTPDTIVSLTTGKKIIVQEQDEEIIRRAAAYRLLCRGAAAPTVNTGL